MRSRLSRRFVLWNGIALGFAVALLMAWGIFNVSDGRPTMRADALMPGNPAAITSIGQWHVDTSQSATKPDDAKPDDAKPDDAKPDGVTAAVREWQSDLSGLRIEIDRKSTPALAWYAYVTDPLPATYRRLQPAETVRMIAAPSGFRADQARLYCSNPGASSAGTLDACLTWNAFLRTGQYTVTVRLSWEPGLDQPMFTDLVVHLDGYIDHQLH